MRFSLRDFVKAVFGLAALVVILEHSGGFSKVVESGAGAFSTGFNTLTGHSGRQITGIRGGTR